MAKGPGSDKKHKKQDIWGLRDLGKEVANLDVLRTYTSADVWYIINRFPFLRILESTEAKDKLRGDLPEAKLVRAESGWVIHSHGFVIASSLGEMLYGNYSEGEEEGGDEEGGDAPSILNPGKGTLVKQSFDTAAEMVALGKANGWEAIYVYEGTSLMGWAAWVVAEELGLKVEGYKPSDEDKAKRDRLRRDGQLEGMTPKLGL